MWNYEKRLEFPVNIKRTDPKMAQLIITQYGGPDGELGASMRYLSQRFAMPYKNEKAKNAKDVSAGAVLVFAIGAAICGLIIFVPKIF